MPGSRGRGDRGIDAVVQVGDADEVAAFENRPREARTVEARLAQRGDVNARVAATAMRRGSRCHCVGSSAPSQDTRLASVPRRGIAGGVSRHAGTARRPCPCQAARARSPSSWGTRRSESRTPRPAGTAHGPCERRVGGGQDRRAAPRRRDGPRQPKSSARAAGPSTPGTSAPNASKRRGNQQTEVCAVKIGRLQSQLGEREGSLTRVPR